MAGHDPSKNRNIIQSPKPSKNKIDIVIENKSQSTIELISVLQKSRRWIYGSREKHPLVKYIDDNKNLEKGWLRNRLPSDIKYTNKCLNSDMRAIYVNQYNLLSGFPKCSGSLKDWQKLFYHAWGITKRSSNSCLLYTSPSPRDRTRSRMPSSA